MPGTHHEYKISPPKREKKWTQIPALSTQMKALFPRGKGKIGTRTRERTVERWFPSKESLKKWKQKRINILLYGNAGRWI